MLLWLPELLLHFQPKICHLHWIKLAGKNHCPDLHHSYGCMKFATQVSPLLNYRRYSEVQPSEHHLLLPAQKYLSSNSWTSNLTKKAFQEPLLFRKEKIFSFTTFWGVLHRGIPQRKSNFTFISSLATVCPQPCVQVTGLFGLCSHSFRWWGRRSNLTITSQPWQALSQLISSL